MAQTVKESACNLGDLGSILGLGTSPGGGHLNPLQYSCLENPHGQKSLASYSPWVQKELDTTEQLCTAQLTIILTLHEDRKRKNIVNELILQCGKCSGNTSLFVFLLNTNCNLYSA